MSQAKFCDGQVLKMPNQAQVDSYRDIFASWRLSPVNGSKS